MGTNQGQSNYTQLVNSGATGGVVGAGERGTSNSGGTLSRQMMSAGGAGTPRSSRFNKEDEEANYVSQSRRTSRSANGTSNSRKVSAASLEDYDTLHRLKILFWCGFLFFPCWFVGGCCTRTRTKTGGGWKRANLVASVLFVIMAILAGVLAYVILRGQGILKF
jgi:hypothetical protein